MFSTSHSPPAAPPATVSLLILGAGWTFTFLRPLLDQSHPDITYQYTTRDGRDGSLKWAYDAGKDGDEQFEMLPKAATVVVTFPIRTLGASANLFKGYERVHGKARWIQLGSTGIWDNGPTLIAQRQDLLGSNPDAKFIPSPFTWTDRHSAYEATNARAMAEDELLALSTEVFVLNLAGLWGGSRDLVNWIERIAPSKEVLRVKGSVHLIHGRDVARAIVAVHYSPPRAQSQPAAIAPPSEKQLNQALLGQRYLLTDLRVYDWWDLASSRPIPAASGATLSSAEEHRLEVAKWVGELLEEEGVHGLPRSVEQIGRAMDSREFWRDFGIMPEVGRWEQGRT